MHSTHEVEEIIRRFQIDGRFLNVTPYGAGHIHDTYASRFQNGKHQVRYIHQWINHHVFHDPEKVMANIERVTCYAREQISALGGDPHRQTLTLIPAEDDRSFYRATNGDYWRTYVFIEGARTYEQVENLNHLFNAAKAFGQFQKLLSTLPGERLHETIPNFHHTPKRYQTFLEVLSRDSHNRAQEVADEIDFVLARENATSIVVDLLATGRIPERVTHNDTKIDNVMIDDVTGEGICIIDLDTVMPGSALYDFGDAVRIGASTSAEDERNLHRVDIDLARFDRLAHGYLEAARDFLTATEIDHLAFAARLITLECGMRFLTDYLNGDVYFKTHRPRHNLDRCRVQFKMVAEMERKAEEMEAIVARYRA